jgi:hypothetical protein
MKRWSVATSLIAVVLLLAGARGQQSAPQGGAVPGELLVKFTASAGAGQRTAMLAARGASRLRRFEALGVEHVRIPAGVTIAAAIAAFKAMPGVAAVQPNYIRHAIQSAQDPPPNDPFWLDGSLWGLAKIQAQPAWTNFTAGDGTVVVASIDTGVNYLHPDLAANMWHNPFEIPDNGIDDDGNGYVDDVYGINTVNHTGDPMDDQGHGTHTSGTVAAVGNNDLGVVGVNWNAKILSCKFLDASGSGTDAGAIECFNYVLAMRNRGTNIRVTTNSWGEQRGSGPTDSVLQAAIDAAGDAGIINIFGAGNDGTDNDVSPFDPASYPSASIVSVASSGPTDRRSSFSNYGATSVHLAAPGENILSTTLGTDYEYLSGTSMATPHVAGVAALLAAMDPTLSVAAIKALMLDNVDQSSRWAGKVVSGGRLNAFKAATAVGTVSPNTPPTVAITAPAAGATFKGPVNLTVAAAADDSDGTIRQVTFYANGALIGTATASPYAVAWNGVVPGAYTLTAVATDNLFATATSAGVPITVLANAPPSVSVSGPLEGSTFTSPATVTVDATASDSDGTVQQVAFFANGAPIGIAPASPFRVTWNAPLGSYALTAVATDNEGATATSAAVHITVDPLPGRLNVALSANGGVASASSTLSPSYPASSTINGDRKGLNFGFGGGWNDGTPNAVPDWLEVDFKGLKLVEEVDVFSLQDSYSSPVEPTPTMTFTTWGLRSFDVQYWDGVNWVNVPGGAVTNNNLVWRQVVFVPLTTSKIRLWLTGGLNGYSRVMEAEAWGTSAGGNAPPTVSITSPSTGTTVTAPATIAINATADDIDGSIQQVDFYANGALVGTATASPYVANWTNVPAGTYSLTAVATDNSGATTTSAAVSLTVANNTPPSVAIAGPIDGALFTAPAAITITATAGDSDGSVASVAFLVNGTPIGTDTTSPYGVSWTNVAPGSYTLTAVATDNLGATATSAAVHVTVNPDPNRINMALAMNGGVASASSTYSPAYAPAGAINGDRKGLNYGNGGGWNDGTPNAIPDWLEVDFRGTKIIQEVDVFSMQDNYSAPVEPTPTMTFTSFGLRAFEVQYWDGTNWVAVPGGAVANNNLVWRQLIFAPVTTAKIRLNITGGLNGYSRVIELEAWGTSFGGNTPPSVSITSPAEGLGVVAPATVTVAASASDADGSVASVAFFANGAPIGTDTTSPYSATWSGVAAGSYTLTAVATDNQGATTTSIPVHVTVAASNVPPSVAIASPVESATFTLPVAVAINATAGDSDGTVASVAFYVNGSLVGTDATSPYGITWNPAAAGAYTLTAVATDNFGATTTSTAVHVTVNPDPNRMNMALAANGGVASASSTYSPSYSPAGAINGDRKGLNFGFGGGWNDGTPNAVPDWLEVDFNGMKLIQEVDVFSMQDNYSSPVEPTPTMTFTSWGLRAFEVQYWNGTSWVDVPGGAVTNNNLVWRQLLFAPVTTSKIRLLITGGLNGYSRVMEVEAWGASAQGPEAAPDQTSASSGTRSSDPTVLSRDPLMAWREE